MAPTAAFALTLRWLAFGVVTLGCSNESLRTPGDGFGTQDSGPVMDGAVADVSVDNWSDENVSPDRIAPEETGQREDTSVTDASPHDVDGGETGRFVDAWVSDGHEDAPSYADVRGDSDSDAADGSTRDAGTVCARTGSMPTCFGNCGPGEVCFTPVICGPLADGGGTCSLGSSTVGDHRCHRACDSSSACAAGEECVRYQFFGCTDYTGGPNGKGICCPAGGCQ
jgi:hypothetical protein